MPTARIGNVQRHESFSDRLFAASEIFDHRAAPLIEAVASSIEIKHTRVSIARWFGVHGRGLA